MSKLGIKGEAPPGAYPQEHFDDELIQEGNALLIAHRDKIRELLLQKDFATARKLLGGALHAIQDFYAHSNWVELHRVDLESGMVVLEPRLAEGTVDGPSSFGGGTSPRVAGRQEYVCLDGSVLMNQLDAGQTARLLDILNAIPPAEAKIVEKTLDDFPLTTEYWGFPSDKPEVAEYLKCRHGSTVAALGLVVGSKGINKDVPGLKYHDLARKLAYIHSMQFILRFLNDAELQNDPAIIAGFLGQPTISSLDPPEVNAGLNGGPNAGQDLFYVTVSGTGFTDWIGHTQTHPTVLWNGKPLETNFIGGPTVPGPPTLHARVEKADVAQPGSVKVSVQELELDDAGNATGTLNSNVVTFTVDPANTVPSKVDQAQQVVDCPGAIRPHRHDRNYLDVNANRWNDTGLTVKEGEKLNFQVLPGLVVWRSGLLGSDESPPQGDSRVNPGNTLLWIDPQIPINVAPIGTLIGMIMDPQSTVALSEKPDGAHYFPIRIGGPLVPAMPANGKLYLGINDGGFFNNGGCFQVRVTRPTR
jgi:hypothetical protein